MITYDFVVTREGDQWLGECVQEPAAHTWAKTLAALQREAIDAVILAADLPDDASPVIHLVPGHGLSESMHEAIELGNWRARIRQEEADLRERTIHAVRSLSEEGYSVRDIAGAVGLTPGRITQIA
ncbi:MAG: hypothetical protein QM705_11625 [Ancrocorticia sp.]